MFPFKRSRKINLMFIFRFPASKKMSILCYDNKRSEAYGAVFAR